MGTYDGSTFTAFSGKDNGSGTYTLVESDLTNLAVNPATNDSSSMTLGVSVTEQEGSADPSAPVTETLAVTVSAVSDAPDISIPSDTTVGSVSATLHAEEDQSGGIVIDLADDGNASSAGIIATVTDLDNPSSETITEFRIDLSAYPDGSYVALSASSADRETVENGGHNLTNDDVSDLGTGSYSITAIEVDADAGTYRLPKGLSLHLPGDYNSSIAEADGDSALIDGAGLLKLPITAVSRDGALTAVVQSDATAGNDILKIYVAPLSEPPSAVNAPGVTGTEDGVVQLSVTVDKSNPSGLLATTVSGIPTGAELGTYDGSTFTAFTANADGTYTDSYTHLTLPTICSV